MGIITKEVEVRPTGKMIQYYRDKGYDAKYRQPLVVNIEDLSDESCVIVDVLCDCCEETICSPTYRDYKKRVEKFDNYACSHCRSVHQKESFMEKYGVDSPAKLEEVRKRMEATSLQPTTIWRNTITSMATRCGIGTLNSPNFGKNAPVIMFN